MALLFLIVLQDKCTDLQARMMPEADHQQLLQLHQTPNKAAIVVGLKGRQECASSKLLGHATRARWRGEKTAGLWGNPTPRSFSGHM